MSAPLFLQALLLYKTIQSEIYYIFFQCTFFINGKNILIKIINSLGVYFSSQIKLANSFLN